MQAPELLKSIEIHAHAGNLAELQALEAHSDKAVRKAARKALHQLRSRGVAVQTPPRAFRLPSLAQGVAQSEPMVVADWRAQGAALEMMLSLPNDHGGALFLATLTPDDEVEHFIAYEQTDGQRSRLLRRFEGKQGVPVDYAMARIRWARDAMVRSGRSAPRALNEVLARLGAAPDERPSSFLLGRDLGEAKTDDASVKQTLAEAGAMMWPLLVDVSGVVRALESVGEEGQQDSMRRAVEEAAKTSNAPLREGLRVLANALDDAAIVAWVHGFTEDAANRRDIAVLLRTSATPEATTAGHTLLEWQTVSLLRQYLSRKGVTTGLPDDASTEHVHDEHCDHDHP